MSTARRWDSYKVSLTVESYVTNKIFLQYPLYTKLMDSVTQIKYENNI